MTVLQPQLESWFALDPFSLAATKGIEFSFFSSGYLDVSVLRVSFHLPIYSVNG